MVSHLGSGNKLGCVDDVDSLKGRAEVEMGKLDLSLLTLLVIGFEEKKNIMCFI